MENKSELLRPPTNRLFESVDPSLYPRPSRRVTGTWDRSHRLPSWFRPSYLKDWGPGPGGPSISVVQGEQGRNGPKVHQRKVGGVHPRHSFPPPEFTREGRPLGLRRFTTWGSSLTICSSETSGGGRTNYVPVVEKTFRSIPRNGPGETSVVPIYPRNLWNVSSHNTLFRRSDVRSPGQWRGESRSQRGRQLTPKTHLLGINTIGHSIVFDVHH